MDIEKSFRHTNGISGKQRETIKDLENLFVDMAHVLNVLPESREKSLSITKLQEAKFWAVECVTKNDFK